MTIVLQRIEEPIQMDSLKMLKDVDVEAGRSSPVTPTITEAATLSSLEAAMPSSILSASGSVVADQKPHEEKAVEVHNHEPQQVTVIEEEQTDSNLSGDSDVETDFVEDFSCPVDSAGHVDMEAHLPNDRKKKQADVQDSNTMAVPTNVILSTSPGEQSSTASYLTEMSVSTDNTGGKRSIKSMLRNHHKNTRKPFWKGKTSPSSADDNISVGSRESCNQSVGSVQSILKNSNSRGVGGRGDDGLSSSNGSRRSVRFEGDHQRHSSHNRNNNANVLHPDFIGDDSDAESTSKRPSLDDVDWYQGVSMMTMEERITPLSTKQTSFNIEDLHDDLSSDEDYYVSQRDHSSPGDNNGRRMPRRLSREESRKKFDKYGASKSKRRKSRINSSQIPNVVSRSDSLSQRVEQATAKCFQRLFGESYSKREGSVVLVAGAILSFNTGFVNGATLSGFLTPGRRESIAAYTTPYSMSALSAAQGDLDGFRYYTLFVLSYLSGSFISGFLTPNGVPFQIEPTYGPTFLVAGVLLLIASILAALESNADYIFFLAAAANGIQNGIASIYSANLIRCSLTGASTDAAIVVAQCLRGNSKQLWKGLVLFGIIISFWCGGIISFFAARRFLTYTLFFNACLFWAIGVGIIVFLVHELDISFRAAISGNWQWKQAIGSLHQSLSSNICDDISIDMSLGDMFDVIDGDGNGEIEPEELLDALLNAGVKISAKGVMVLIKSADSNGDGTINREEWDKIVGEIKDQDMEFHEQIESKRRESNQDVSLDVPSFH